MERNTVEPRGPDGAGCVFTARVARHRRRGLDGHNLADREPPATVGEDRRSAASEHRVSQDGLDRDVRGPSSPGHEQDALGIPRGRGGRESDVAQGSPFRRVERLWEAHPGGSLATGAPHFAHPALPSRMPPCPVQDLAADASVPGDVVTHVSWPTRRNLSSESMSGTLAEPAADCDASDETLS
jgi:hypothetical protein